MWDHVNVASSVVEWVWHCVVEQGVGVALCGGARSWCGIVEQGSG